MTDRYYHGGRGAVAGDRVEESTLRGAWAYGSSRRTHFFDPAGLRVISDRAARHLFASVVPNANHLY